MTKKITIPLLLIIPVLIFFIVLKLFVTDTPIYDDIEAFNGLVLKIISDIGFAEKALLLIDNSSDHVIFLGRLFCVVYFFLTSDIDYSNLIFLGNLSLIGLFFLFYKILKANKQPLFYLFPIGLLLFNIQNWYYSSFWLITVFQFPVILFLVILTLYLVNNKNRYIFFISVLLAAIITFSHGNGFCIWLCGIFMLWSDKKNKRLFIWTLSGLVVSYFFFHKMLSSQNSSFEGFQDVLNAFIGFTSFMGTYFDFIPTPTIPNKIRAILPVLFGTLSMFAVVYSCIDVLFFKRHKVLQKQSSVYLLGCMLFVIFSALIIGKFRSIDNPLRFLTVSPHYRASSGVFISCFYLWILTLLPENRKKAFFKWSLAFIAVPYITSYVYILPTVRDFYQTNETNAYNQENNRAGIMGPLNTSHGTYADSVMRKSITQHIYRYPGNPVLNKIRTHLMSTEVGGLSDKKVTSFEEYLILDNLGDMNRIRPDDGFYVALKSDSALWIFPAKTEFPTGVGNLLKYTSGFTSVISKNFLSKGVYQVVVVKVQNKQIEYTKLKSDITID